MKQIAVSMILLVAIATQAFAQKLVFTKEPHQKLDDQFQSWNGFMPGDPVYGFVYLNDNDINYHKIEGFWDGPKMIVPVTLSYYSKKEGWYNNVSLEVPYQDYLANSTLKNRGLYVKLLPTAPNEITPQSVNLLKAICAAGPEGITFEVTVGKGPSYEMDELAKGKFFIVLEKGFGPYTEWLSPYLQSEKSKAKADSIANVTKMLDKGDAMKWQSTVFTDKALAAQMGTAVKQFVSHEVLKTYVVDTDWEYSKNNLGVVLDRYARVWGAIKTNTGVCEMGFFTVWQEYITGGQFANKIKVKWTDTQIMRCEHMMAQLKKYP